MDLFGIILVDVLFFGVYGIFYWIFFYFIAKWTRNVKVPPLWTIIWLAVSSLDFLTSFVLDGTPDEANLSPFLQFMDLPALIALLVIAPLLPLKGRLMACIGNPDIRIGGDGRFGGWKLFLFDFFSDLILCFLAFLIWRSTRYFWHLVRPKTPTPTVL